jgi:hypothetical protein
MFEDLASDRRLVRTWPARLQPWLHKRWKAQAARFLRVLPPDAGPVVGISLLGIASLVVFLFACRCWKNDLLYKIKGQEGG